MKPRRAAALLVSAALGVALLTGCGSDGVDCNVDQCTVTIQRETDASVEVLGVEAKFVSADDDSVTLQVAGQDVTLMKGRQAVEVGGLELSLSSVTPSEVQVQVSR